MKRVQRLWLMVSFGLVALLLATGLQPASIRAAAPVDFMQVSPALIAASSDYATEVRGYTWDFSDERSYGREMTRPNFVGGGSLVNGWFVGTTSSNIAKVWLQDATIPSTVPTQNEGGFRPIDTSRYRFLTYRMCASANTFTTVYWHKDRSFAPGTFGSTKFKPVQQGCHVYTMDFVADRPGGDGTLDWQSGPIQGLALQPSNAPGIEIKLDYARLSASAPSTVVTARWTPTNVGFDLMFDTDPSGAHATLIATIPAGNSGKHDWTTPNLAPGTYYLIARSGNNRSVSSAFVVNAPPVARVLAPSYTSGPDYASTVVGNPWDMSDPADVESLTNVVGATFSNGVFAGTSTQGNPAGDPAVELHTTEPIDPSRFFYLTYRMRVEGEQDIGTGSVARVLWWTGTAVPETASTTKDIVVYDGLTSVSIDLRTVALEPGSYSTWSSGSKLGFRLDPHEFPSPKAFAIDDVKLTGNDLATAGSYAIRYTTSDTNNQSLTTSFFYDTDRSGADGQPITCATPSTGGGSRKIFLPAVANGVGGSASVGGSSCVWNLPRVANDQYYIYMVVSDGVNTTSTYSDTPVEVRR